MKETYLAQWVVEVSYHLGKMKKEKLYSNQDLIKVLLVSTYHKLVLLLMEMKKNSGNYLMKDYKYALTH